MLHLYRHIWHTWVERKILFPIFFLKKHVSDKNNEFPQNSAKETLYSALS